MKIAPGKIIPVFMILFYSISIVPAQTNETIPDITSKENQTKTGGNNNSINGHILLNKSYNIRVVLDHIFISKKNDSLLVSEIVVFRNEGQEIYYIRDNHTFFAISTPPDAQNLKTQVMECCLVQEEGVVYMDPMQTIKPGDNFEMQISYTITPRSSEYVFNKSAIYNTTSLSIFVDKKSGTRLEGLYEALTLAGTEYDVIAFNNPGVGETISIPIKIMPEPGYLYAGIGLFSLFSIGLVYHFRGKLFGKLKKEHTLEELESEKKKIFQAIYGFEKHAGAESSEEYRKLMEEYRQKAIQILIKIDNLKNKGQSGVFVKRDETDINRL